MFISSRTFLSLSLAVASALSAHGFTFTHTPPASCAPMRLNWSGGKGPFRLIIVRPGHPMRRIDIPDSNSGTFLTPALPYVQGDQIMLAMSDATGFTAGGLTALIPVGPRPDGQNACSTEPIKADYFFHLDRPLEQCQAYPLRADPAAVLPIIGYGFEPGVSSFSVQGDLNSHTVEWKANYPVGTSLVFCVRDSANKDLGCSQVQTVGRNDDDSCLPDAGGGTPVGAIAGGVVGGVLALGLIGFLVWFFFRKRRAQASGPKELKLDLSYDPTVNGPASPPHGHLLPNAYTNPAGAPMHPSSPHGTSFYGSQTTTSGVTPYGYAQPGYQQAFSQSGQSSSSQGGSQFYTTNGDVSQYPASLNAHIGKGAQQQPQVLRPVVQHQDMADAMPVQDNVVEELPPQYSESRAPIPGLVTSAESEAGSSSTSTPQSQAQAVRARKGG